MTTVYLHVYTIQCLNAGLSGYFSTPIYVWYLVNACVIRFCYMFVLYAYSVIGLNYIINALLKYFSRTDLLRPSELHIFFYS